MKITGLRFSVNACDSDYYLAEAAGSHITISTYHRGDILFMPVSSMPIPTPEWGWSWLALDIPIEIKDGEIVYVDAPWWCHVELRREEP